MGMEELLGLGERGMRMRPGSGPGPEILGGLLMSLLASKMSGGPCGGPEEAGEHNCDECHLQGNCPLESLKRAMGGNGACSADGVKAADLLMAQAKVAGLETQVELLGRFLEQFRERVDKMAKAHKAEVERLTSRNQAEVESLSQVLSEQQESFLEERSRNRQAYLELSQELEAAQEKIDAVLMIIASSGQGRPSRKILAEIQKALETPKEA